MQSNITEGKFLHVRLLLEGIEVPVISVTTQETVGAPATAEVEIPATAAALSLRPRTNVLVFYFEPRVQDYCLMFVGELVGVNYSKSDAGRSVTLQCMDHTSYWKIAYAYYFKAGGDTGDISNLIRQRGIFLQARGMGLVDATGQITLSNLLREQPQTPALSHITGLVGGLIRILEYLTGELVDKEGEVQPLNSFFSYSAIKNRLLQQLTSLGDDDSAQTLFQVQVLTDFLNNGVLSTRDIISYEELVEYVLSYIFHQHFPIMRPKYQNTELRTKISVRDTGLDTQVSNLINAVTLIQFEVESGKFADALGLISDLTTKDKFLETATQISVTSPPEISITVNNLLEVANSQADALQKALENSPVKNVILTSIATLLETLQKARIAAESEITRSYRNGNLYTRVFSPNLFFAAPPRCNVIFPEYYNRLSLSRSFIDEATRLDMDSSTLAERLGVAAVKGLEHVYAPSITLPQGAAIVNEQLISRILPHEKHTGIIPRLSDIGNRLELEAAAKQSTAALSAELQKIADFHFFVDRLQPRSMSISGKFNPDAVVGLPCVVLDNANIDPTLKDVEDIKKNKIVLQQFLGVISSITHLITQDTGASTQMSLSYVRSHRGEDDDIARAVALAGADKAYLAQLAEADKQYSEKKLELEELKNKFEAARANNYPQIALELSEQYLRDSATVENEYKARVTQLQAQIQAAQNAQAAEVWEKTVTPSWVSDKYSTQNIGKDFYEGILGIRAITNATSNEEKELFGGSASSPIDKVSLESVENAVDVLTLLYARQNRISSTTRFAEQYTFRRVATMKEMVDKDNGFFGPVFDTTRGLTPIKGTVPIQFDTPECYKALAEAAAEIDGREEKTAAILEYRRSVQSRGLRN